MNNDDLNEMAKEMLKLKPIIRRKTKQWLAQQPRGENLCRDDH